MPETHDLYLNEASKINEQKNFHFSLKDKVQ